MAGKTKVEAKAAVPPKGKQPKGKNVAVVGATGQVGGVMRDLLAERELPIADLRYLASERSAGHIYPWRGKEVKVEDLAQADFEGIDIAIMSAGKTVSKEFAPKLASAGAIVVDNSSAWRMDSEVPLVVADVNDHALGQIPKGIVANPNCTTMVAMVALKPLHELAGLRSMVISTYQAISGAGLPGVAEFSSQLDVVDGRGRSPLGLLFDGSAVEFPETRVFADTVAFNVLPMCGSVVADGSLETDEEQKLRHESRKILELPEMEVWATCVRVPVLTGHSMAVNATFEQAITPEAATEALQEAPGVKVAQVPTPQGATGGDVTLVGRIRSTGANALSLFLSGDNLRKGAALNAIQIAERLG